MLIPDQWPSPQVATKLGSVFSKLYKTTEDDTELGTAACALLTALKSQTSAEEKDGDDTEADGISPIDLGGSGLTHLTTTINTNDPSGLAEVRDIIASLQGQNNRLRRRLGVRDFASQLARESILLDWQSTV